MAKKKIKPIFLAIEAGLILRLRCCGKDILPPYPDWIKSDVICKCEVCGNEYTMSEIFNYWKSLFDDLYIEARLLEETKLQEKKLK
jgi:hypothetical protein